jgi:ABC-type nitrate/sulfonate/bicarbonate transport system substrate-binding protein
LFLCPPRVDPSFSLVGRIDVAQALKDGRVDALNISWNNTVGVEAAGITLKCITCDEEFQLASETTVVPDDIFKQDRRYIIGFGRAMAKATLFAETNPEAAIAIMKKVAPQEQTDPAFTKTFFAAALAVMKPRQSGKYVLQDIGGWERLQNFMAVWRSVLGRNFQPKGEECFQAERQRNAADTGRPSDPVEDLTKDRGADQAAGKVTGENGF